MKAIPARLLLSASLLGFSEWQLPTARAEPDRDSQPAGTRAAERRFPDPEITGPTLHVAPDGDDDQPGTRAEPMASLEAAAEKLEGHEEPARIILHAGRYEGGVDVGEKAQATKELPRLLIRAARGEDGSYERVIFEGSRYFDGAEPVPGAEGVYKVEGVKINTGVTQQMWENDTRTRYLLAAELEAVKHYPASFYFDPHPPDPKNSTLYFHTSDGRAPAVHEVGLSRHPKGIYLWRGDVTLRGIEVRDVLARGGAAIRARGSRCVIEDCTARNAEWGFLLHPGGKTYARRGVIRGCRAYDVGGGAQSRNFDTLVEDCRFFKKRDRFMIEAKYRQNDTGILIYHPSKGATLRGNLAVGFSNGTKLKNKGGPYRVEHNTFARVEVGLRPAGTFSGKDSEATIRSNIFADTRHPFGGDPAQWLESDHKTVSGNVFWDPDRLEAIRSELEEPVARNAQSPNHFADPRFAAPGQRDFRLLPSSPAPGVGSDERSVAGALPVVAEDFADIRPPRLRLEADKPARRADGGELYFQSDPWLNGGRRLVRELEPGDRPWLTPRRTVELRLDAHDVAGPVESMRIQIGEQPWSQPRPFQPTASVQLPEEGNVTVVRARVADARGNWSEPRALAFRVAREGPRLVGEPEVHTNRHGVVIAFETDVPAATRMDYGKSDQYGSTHRLPAERRHLWVGGDGGEWIEVYPEARIRNTIVLTTETLESGATYHYRLRLRDELGNQRRTQDFTFTLEGEPATRWVSPEGKDGAAGMREAPWRTLQHAADRALPGERIVLRPGLYTGQTLLSHGGLKGEPLTIAAEKRRTAVLDGGRRVEACLRLHEAPHVVLEGLKFQWFDESGVYARDSAHLAVRHCTFFNSHWRTFSDRALFADHSPHLSATYSLFHHVNFPLFVKQSPHARIEHNTIFQCQTPLFLMRSVEGSRHRYNSYVYNYGVQVIRLGLERPANLESFESDYNNLAANMRRKEAWKRLFHEERLDYIREDRRNFTPPEGADYDTHVKMLVRVNGVPERETFTHIDADGETPWLVEMSHESRHWSGTALFHSLEDWRGATGNDRHSVFAAPRYADPLRGDFRLRPDSPNLGVGPDDAPIGAFGKSAGKAE